MTDKYYTSFTEYFEDTNPKPEHSFKKYGAYNTWKRNKRDLKGKYDKHMAGQITELETLRSGQPKTVNYSTATSVDDITKAGVEADDERARAAALEQLEKERLGAMVGSMGSTSLLRGLK